MREEFEIMGVDFNTRGARLDEHITVLRKLWRGGWAEHHGTHFDFPPLRLSPRPRAPIPIYGSGEAPSALRRAATLDGWLGAAYELETIAELVDRLAAARRDAGTADCKAYEVMVGLPRVPSLADWRRLEEFGVTSVSVAPWIGADPGAGRIPREELLKAIDTFVVTVLDRL
jgi:alkanesulfonate monooxygenase SsuD/methylene tetrahydromethanopterin reductase-like flavin-dependent oxidoreductase (luciferase family)